MFLPLGYYTFTGIINFTTAFGLCILLIMRWKRSAVVRRFFWFCLSVAYWSFFYIFFLSAKNESTAEFYVRTCMIGVFFMPTTFLDFLFVFFEKTQKKYHVITLLNYILSLIFASTAYTHLYVKGLSPHLVFPFWPEPGIVFHLAILHFGIIFVYCFWLIYKNLREVKGVVWNQVIYILIGIILGVVGGSTNYFCWYRIPIPPFLNILVSVYLMMIVYAIIRYRLMDIRLMISRTMIFIFVYIPILSIPVVITYWARDSLIGYLGVHFWLVPTLLGMVLAVVGLSIFLYLQSRAEHKLLSEEHACRELINSISEEIVHIHELDEAADLITRRCYEGIDVECICVFVLNKARGVYELKSHMGADTDMDEFEQNHFMVSYLTKKRAVILWDEIDDEYKKLLNEKPAVLVPILREETLFGIIMLGGKRTGRMYTELEIDALKVLGDQMALVMENIQRFNEKQNLQLQLIENKRLVDLGHLASSIGHQLCNNVNIMTLAAQMMQANRRLWDLAKEDSELENDLKQFIHDIVEQGKDCRGILEELGSYGRKETEEDLQGYVELGPVLEKALKMARLRNPKFSQIRLDLDLKVELAVVQGSFLQLKNVMVNLLNNSFDAIMMEKSVSSDPGYNGYIRVSLEENCDFYQMHFIDNGIGMDEDTKQKVFKIPMFTKKTSVVKRRQRQEKEKEDVTGGTGMGSYTVRMIVLNHGGDVIVHKAGPHKGCDILLKLPKKTWRKK